MQTNAKTAERLDITLENKTQEKRSQSSRVTQLRGMPHHQLSLAREEYQILRLRLIYSKTDRSPMVHYQQSDPTAARQTLCTETSR